MRKMSWSVFGELLKLFSSCGLPEAHRPDQYDVTPNKNPVPMRFSSPPPQVRDVYSIPNIFILLHPSPEITTCNICILYRFCYTNDVYSKGIIKSTLLKWLKFIKRDAAEELWLPGSRRAGIILYPGSNGHNRKQLQFCCCDGLQDENGHVHLLL